VRAYIALSQTANTSHHGVVLGYASSHQDELFGTAGQECVDVAQGKVVEELAQRFGALWLRRRSGLFDVTGHWS
jgi:hypothetical protein